MKTLHNLVTGFAAISMIFSACSKDSKNESSSSESDKVVVGYIPGYADVKAVTDSLDLNIVTHINLAFFAPGESGEMMANGEPVNSYFDAAGINYVVTKAHAKNRKVLASIGGGAASADPGNMAEQFKPENRTRFIDSLATLLTYFNLDGIDIDIEGTTLSTIDGAGNYTPFIAALSAKVNPMGKLVTVATAGWTGGEIPEDSYEYFDLINIMSYDNGWGETGNHATYEAAVAHVEKFLALGAPANKLVLGLPFYGYHNTVGDDEISYSGLLKKYGTVVTNVDNYDGYGYNGIPTIEEKTKYAMANIRGVMIWELSQDVQGQYSLLQAVGRNTK